MPLLDYFIGNICQSYNSNSLYWFSITVSIAATANVANNIISRFSCHTDKSPRPPIPPLHAWLRGSARLLPWQRDMLQKVAGMQLPTASCSDWPVICATATAAATAGGHRLKRVVDIDRKEVGLDNARRHTSGWWAEEAKLNRGVRSSSWEEGPRIQTMVSVPLLLFWSLSSSNSETFRFTTFLLTTATSH